ncbi:MAG: class I SAM-dependent methyltransferase [Hymenobacteraceae bacterium]|nr:class I SAM-dependent methyltransferase [Hymenobacteraceae bacterium]
MRFLYPETRAFRLRRLYPLFRSPPLKPITPLLFGLVVVASCTFSQSENTPAETPEPAAAAAAERPTLPTPTAGAPAGKASPAGEAALDPAGISRRYMGRQIARIMGQESAAHFERATREREERPDILLEELDLRPTDVVADIGAGTGYFTFRLAPLVPQGMVYAVELQPQQMLRLTNEVMARKLPNVKPVHGTTQTPNLSVNSVDVVLLVDTYHEFAYPKEMMASISRALKPKGRVVLVEYRAENAAIPVKAVHKMSFEQCKKELLAAGLAYREARETLPRQHMLVFEKLPE